MGGFLPVTDIRQPRPVAQAFDLLVSEGEVAELTTARRDSRKVQLRG